jgi:hypothetical protein
MNAEIKGMLNVGNAAVAEATASESPLPGDT